MNIEILEKLKYIERNQIINGEIEENVLYDDEAKEILQYVEKLENIRKEVREYINWRLEEHQNMDKYQMEELLEILDKGE